MKNVCERLWFFFVRKTATVALYAFKGRNFDFWKFLTLFLKISFIFNLTDLEIETKNRSLETFSNKNKNPTVFLKW